MQPPEDVAFHLRNGPHTALKWPACAEEDVTSESAHCVTLGTKQARAQSSIIFKGKPACPLLCVFREYLHLFTDDLISNSCGGLMILANARHYWMHIRGYLEEGISKANWYGVYLNIPCTTPLRLKRPCINRFLAHWQISSLLRCSPFTQSTVAWSGPYADFYKYQGPKVEIGRGVRGHAPPRKFWFSWLTCVHFKMF